MVTMPWAWQLVVLAGEHQGGGQVDDVARGEVLTGGLVGGLREARISSSKIRPMPKLLMRLGLRSMPAKRCTTW
jgi:hypothetical protein